MMSGYFITGTDTDCGKTVVTLGLMAHLQARGLRVQGMKPVASGAKMGPAGLVNEDALGLQRQASRAVDYSLVNPYAFAPAIAPHLAAAQAGIAIELGPIVAACQALASESDYLLVEGVGGWRVPLGPDLEVADMALALGLPVILVVGMKLGCLNHALLTMESIRRTGIELAGWVANGIDPEMLEVERNLDTLQNRIPAPLLGIVPYQPQPTADSVAVSLVI